jgi:alpha-glucosidase
VSATVPSRSEEWWRTATIYQIYPRSFADANGDGVGDLAGVRSHLDHLAWLGVDGIWLSPVTVSPDADFGYDVADYCDIDPDYGDLASMERLIAEADRRGIAVLMDLVPNHTSDRHRWFSAARSGREARYRDFYVWADPGPEGGPPNNWVSTFGGPAWTFDEASGQYYLHNFLPEQPDLNWWNPEVRQAFDEILRFWFDRGIAGFRIDVCNMVIKDAHLRDNPPSGPDDPFLERMFGQRWLYNANRPEVHQVIARWRQVADSYAPGRLLLGETNVESLETLAEFYGNGHDELHLGFNFPFLESDFSAEALRGIVERTEELLPAGAWPVWTGSNHDVSRLATRWADGDERKVRLALLVLVTLRGTVVLYQGDEIGLPDGAIERHQVLDPVGMRFWPAYKGRDPERTPMPWDRTGGFSPAGVEPWLPMTDPAACNVADQRDDPDSILAFTKNLLALRRELPALGGTYTTLPSPEGTWCFARHEGRQTVTVVANFTAAPVVVDDVRGELHLSSARGPRPTLEGARLALGAFMGAVVVGG